MTPPLSLKLILQATLIFINLGHMHEVVGLLSTEELVSLFNSTFSDTLDSVAPVRTKIRKPLASLWLNNSNIRKIKRECGGAEQWWKRDKLQISFQILKDLLDKCQLAVKNARAQYFSNLIDKICRYFLGCYSLSPPPLPPPVLKRLSLNVRTS